MKKKRKTLLLILLVLLVGWIGVSEAAVDDISSGITRVHILANSNSEEDIELKFKVRDRLLKECTNEKIESFSLAEIEDICKKEIDENGFAYDVQAERGMFYFPTKTYKNITLPAGDYHALRIVIGEGMGENWWCVMYPSMSASALDLKNISPKELEELKNCMKSDNFNMVEGEEVTLKPSFKLVELWQKLRKH